MDEILQAELRLLFKELSSLAHARHVHRAAAINEAFQRLMEQELPEGRIHSIPFSFQIKIGERGERNLTFAVPWLCKVAGLLFNSKPILTQRCHDRFLINGCSIGVETYKHPFEMNGRSVMPGQNVVVVVQFPPRQFEQPLHASLITVVEDPPTEAP